MNTELPHWIHNNPIPPLYSSWEANNKQQIRIRNEMQAGVVFVKKWPAPEGIAENWEEGVGGEGGDMGMGEISILVQMEHLTPGEFQI